MYDEIENFKQYDDSSFNYPYDARKIKLRSYTFNFTNPTDYDYSYHTNKIKMELSQICLEDPWYKQVLIN